MRVNARDAKNRFGSLGAQARREPIVVERAGHHDTVILSVERRVAFEAGFGDGLAAENERFESQGIPGADLRPW